MTDDAQRGPATAENTRAWDVLVDAYLDDIWRLATQTGMSVAAAAAVCELTWLRLAEHLDSRRAHVEGRRPLSDWIRHTALEESRREQRRAAWHLQEPPSAVRPRLTRERHAQTGGDPR